MRHVIPLIRLEFQTAQHICNRGMQRQQRIRGLETQPEHLRPAFVREETATIKLQFKRLKCQLPKTLRQPCHALDFRAAQEMQRQVQLIPFRPGAAGFFPWHPLRDFAFEFVRNIDCDEEAFHADHDTNAAKECNH